MNSEPFHCWLLLKNMDLASFFLFPMDRVGRLQNCSVVPSEFRRESLLAQEVIADTGTRVIS